MADSNFRGPVTSMGSLEDPAAGTSTVTSANQANAVISQVGPLDGPSVFYQNVAIADVRGVPFNKDGFRPGQVPAFLSIPDFFAVDNVPQQASTTTLAALQLATAGTNITLATAQVQNTLATQQFVAAGVPIIPSGTTIATTVPITLDFGFTTGTTAANSSTVSVADNTQFYLGQWIVIGGAGNTAGTQALVTQVTSIATANITGVTIFPTAATAIGNAPIGQGNLFGADLIPVAQPGQAAASATSWNPDIQAGLARVHNPREMLARAISVSAQTTTATTALTITGYDVWRRPMVEKITIPSGNRASASTFFGQKAFKHIVSIAVQTTAVGSVSVGLSDVFGMSVRADHFGQIQAFWNNCTVPTALGFTAAATTAPATNTSGDVLGTIQVSTNGTGSAAAVATAAVSNGTSRLTIIQNVGVWNNVFGTPNNQVPMFGVTPPTA